MRIRRAALGAFVAMAFAGCLADTNETADEHVGQSGEALSTSTSVILPTEEARVDAELPRWHVYIAGNDNRGHDHPVSIDEDGRMIAVRDSDHKEVQLSLANHWMMGDRYFDEYLRNEGISFLDLVMIASDLFQKKGALAPFPGAHRTRSTSGCVECGGDVNPFPTPGPTNPGPVAGTAGKGSGKGGPPPTGGGNAPHQKDTGWNPANAPHGRPDPAKQKARLSGVYPGDPAPVPFHGRYTPLPGEQTEVFRCEGVVVSGYKHACPDFKATATGMKWSEKLVKWENRFFTAHNISRMSPGDWKLLCEILSTTTFAVVCSGLVFACAEGEVITLGGITVGCLAAWGVLCGVHSVVDSVLAAHCGEAMAKH